MTDETTLLPELDRDYLKEKEYEFEIFKEGSELHLVVHRFAFPKYQPAEADLLIIIPAGYPNAPLDMFWTFPDVMLPNGGWPAQCQHHQLYRGRNWQRWSRHFQTPWRVGVDSLRTFFASIRAEIAKRI